MAAAAPALPYSIKSLTWDNNHHFNSQNKYGYLGTKRKLSDPMLQCEMCEQWFFLTEVGCVPKETKFVPFQRNYRFSCRVCTAGPEHFELQTNTWTSIVLTALYNLQLSEDGTSLKAGVSSNVNDVVSWVQEHWGGLTCGRNLSQMLDNSAIPKCLQYPANSNLFSLSEDRSKVTLKHVSPSKLLLSRMVHGQLTG